MSYRFLPAIAILTIILFSCGSPKVLVSNKTNAETAAASGNYAEALKSWKSYLNETPIEAITGQDFAAAAKVANKSGNLVRALSWFDQARYKNYSDFEMYNDLAEIYRKQKNISKELTALEFIRRNFSDKADEINSRLFQVYNEIGLTGSALDVWNDFDADSKNELSNLIIYYGIRKQQNDSTVCDSIAPVILMKNPQQLEALEWMAIRYYWMGENRYKIAMGKYNENKTTKHYRVLLKELDKSTADFKISLTYLEKLWKLNPGEKYAGYFTNIYARFGDDEKSKYYRKYLK